MRDFYCFHKGCFIYFAFNPTIHLIAYISVKHSHSTLYFIISIYILKIEKTYDSKRTPLWGPYKIPSQCLTFCLTPLTARGGDPIDLWLTDESIEGKKCMHAGVSECTNFPLYPFIS